MELHHLMLLRELAERGSITAVAAATDRTPSAVSQQLRALQRAAGRTLIIREGRGVRLTDAGIALAAESVRIATAVTQVEANWQRWWGEPGGRVVLSVFPSVGELLLPRLLTALTRFPDLRLEVVDNDVAQPEFAGLARHVDLVLAHSGEVIDAGGPRGLLRQFLFTEPVDVAVPLDHPLASRRSITAADVVNQNWVGVPPGYPLDGLLSSLARATGEQARLVMRSTDFGILAALVAAGHGIALLPRYCTDAAAAGVVLLPVDDVALDRRVELIARTENAARAAVTEVIDALVEVTARYRKR